VIYWLMSNIMTIGQQYLTNHLISAPTRTGSGGTSAERRAKQAGSATTPKAQGQ
jgi:membrane protein insertase Oxa1/YidC/SpoIIIJ